MKGKLRSTILVMLSAIFNAVFVTIFNLIYNRLIIRYYGSSISGLISTLGQFVSLFTIIEGGFSVAAVVASYEPIINKDYDKLNAILYTAKKYLQKISLWVFLISSILGCIYVQFIDSPLSALETYILLGITILTTTLSINFVSRYSIVLSGHNLRYFYLLFSAISKTLSWAISIFLILNNANIIYIYLMNVGYVVIHSTLLRIYERKHFPYITYKAEYDKSLIKGTNHIVFQKITSTIFTSTDLVLISVGISLESASVYHVYNQIYQALCTFLTSICSAPSDSFGLLIKEKRNDKLFESFCLYQKFVQIISSVIFLTAGLAIIPFVKIYTKGVEDANYIVPSLAICLFTYYYIKLNNVPFGLIINSSGQFDLQNKQCLIAAVVNVIASIVLMHFLGLQGIVIGSILGTLIMTIMNVRMTMVNILNIKSIKFVMIMIVNYMISLLLIWTSFSLKIEIPGYLYWAIYSCICLFISICIILLVNYVIDKNTVRSSFLFCVKRIIRSQKR